MFSIYFIIYYNAIKELILCYKINKHLFRKISLELNSQRKRWVLLAFVCVLLRLMSAFMSMAWSSCVHVTSSPTGMANRVNSAS